MEDNSTDFSSLGSDEINRKVEDDFSVINRDIALKTILFSIIFYIMTTRLICHIVEKNIPVSLETSIIQSIIFGITLSTSKRGFWLLK